MTRRPLRRAGLPAPGPPGTLRRAVPGVVGAGTDDGGVGLVARASREQAVHIGPGRGRGRQPVGLVGRPVRTSPSGLTRHRAVPVTLTQLAATRPGSPEPDLEHVFDIRG